MFDFTQYVSLRRWISYYHQIYEVIESKPQSILIIGGGDGIIEPIFKAMGIDVAVFDKLEELHPDYCGDLRNIETIIKDEKFDTVLCCQVLEHIEFEHFERVVAFLSQIANHKTIISLPFRNVSLSGWFQFLNKSIIFNFGIPLFWMNITNKYHKWEMGTKEVSQNDVAHILSKYFEIEKRYKVELYPYHYFYILGKKD